MKRIAGRNALAGSFALALAACAAPQSLPAPPAQTFSSPALARPAVANVSGVYEGTVVETSGKRSEKYTLKITLKQSGDKFTGIFDIVLKTIQDQFPIIKGVVSEVNGKTELHFVIEGSPGRNAKAFAAITGNKLNGRAKVPPKNGPAVRFKYTTTKT